MIRKDAKLGMGVDERTWEFKCAKPADVTTWISTLRYALWAVNSGDLAREVSAYHISECPVAPRLLELCSAHGHVYLPQSCMARAASSAGHGSRIHRPGARTSGARTEGAPASLSFAPAVRV